MSLLIIAIVLAVIISINTMFPKYPNPPLLISIDTSNTKEEEWN